MTDLVIHNAKVWTGDARRPLAEALAVRGGRIEAVGSDAEVRRLAGPRTETINARGRLVVPGFNDAHVHFIQGGMALLGVDLRPAKDEGEFAAILRGHVQKTPPGEWITGGRWDHEAWPSRRRPSRGLIDAFTSRHPVLLPRLDGHMALANGEALRLGGVSRNTPDPAGGQIERDESGEPTGILIDAAIGLVSRVMPPPSEEQLLRAARAAMTHAAARGVTSVHSPVDAGEFRILRLLAQRGDLTTRVYAMPYSDCWRQLREEGLLPFGEEEEEEEEEARRGQDARDTLAAASHATFRAGCVKLFADGSLGAGSALFSEPYEDNPASCGLAMFAEEELHRLVAEIDSAGLQVALHAIGDQAVRWALGAFEAAAHGFRGTGFPACAAQPRSARPQKAVPRGTPPRHRIEHAQMVQPADRARFAALDVIASIQPTHCTDDMRWVERRMGRRTAWAYPFRSLLDAGARLALGTDWPVEALDPMATLHAAVTRERPEGGPPGGWHGEERVTIEEALTAHTAGSAYAEFQEHEKGAIAPGQLADLVILSRDILTIPPREILSTRVEMTVLKGRVIQR